MNTTLRVVIIAAVIITPIRLVIAPIIAVQQLVNYFLANIIINSICLDEKVFNQLIRLSIIYNKIILNGLYITYQLALHFPFLNIFFLLILVDYSRINGIKYVLLFFLDSSAENEVNLSELFDVIVESYKVGIRKPDPKIYDIAMEQLNLKPHECIFLDDLGINLKYPAKIVSSSRNLTKKKT